MNTYDTTIVRNELVANKTYKMVISCPDAFIAAFSPGRFVHIKIPGLEGHILRRPISVCSIDESTATLIYRVVGDGTKALSGLGPNDKINILGPVGTAFYVGKNYGSIALVGGGLGVAPLIAIPKVHNHINYSFFAGFGNEKDVYEFETITSLCDYAELSTMDGSAGTKGTSVEMLSRYLKKGNKVDAVFACGPVPMFKSLAKLMDEYKDIACQISLEERMGCGYGACLTCVCKIKAKDGFNFKRVCVDGPVFNLRGVIFNA